MISQWSVRRLNRKGRDLVKMLPEESKAVHPFGDMENLRRLVAGPVERNFVGGWS